MTTEEIKYVATDVGSIPSPSNWNNDGFAADDCGCDEPVTKAHGLDFGDPSINFIEKAIDGKANVKDISKALDEYKRLHKAGFASPAEILTLARAYPKEAIYQKELKKQGISDDDKLVIGGPASVELVDREGHLITTDALSKAFDKYMENIRTRNAMVLHSDVQVGWALPAYISKSGKVFKSGVKDGEGLFFITELRNDTKIAKKVAEQIHSGKLKSYSIAGSALKTQNIQKGIQKIMQVDELELAEVTVCEKGVNQAASFDIIKANDAATSSCIDGSCLITKEHTHEEPKKEVELMFKSDGNIDFTKSFFNFLKKNFTLKDILDNYPAREREHHNFLDSMGFPSEVEAETRRYVPVSDVDPSGHQYVPWAVNSAGQNLSMSHITDALTPPKLGSYKKPGIQEGANSIEVPVKKATDDFFSWMAQDSKHMYKESCPCEFCFQKSSSYKGTIERPTNFLD
tara:strand:- start:254 stop:1630 length:1377 start_codon:yes stop_codon:yes gene_type:complete